jgi:primase-polymerase (primpol)-like protein
MTPAAAVNTPAKPALLQLNPAGIPEEFRAINAWIGWRLELRGGRWNKTPINSRTGDLAKTDDPATWSTFVDALKAYRDGVVDGVGFVRTADFVFLDLDGCYKTNPPPAWATKIIEALTGFAYMQRSTRGEGVGLITRGRVPAGRRQWDDPKHEHVGYAFYDSSRYLAFTGHQLPGSVEPRDATPILTQLHAELFPRRNGNGSAQPARPVILAHSDIIERARRAHNGDKFSRLFDGNHGDYPSQSEADLALCTMLAFWCGRDAGRIDSLFRQSGLYREKWEWADYRNRTIEKAIADTTEVWNPRREGAERPVMAADSVEPSTGLPEIRVADRQLRDLSADALAALTAANQPPKLFSRAGSVVRVDLAKDGGPMIINVSDVHLRGEMTRAANFLKVKKTKDGFVRIAVSPPLDAARDLLSRPPQELN